MCVIRVLNAALMEYSFCRPEECFLSAAAVRHQHHQQQTAAINSNVKKSTSVLKVSNVCNVSVFLFTVYYNLFSHYAKTTPNNLFSLTLCGIIYFVKIIKKLQLFWRVIAESFPHKKPIIAMTKSKQRRSKIK